ncbi:hypothetical protein UK23_28895 [Lentzea aerocolonigenes]|uniref:Uncharacterized protein n=1 Tax=Lentzea aerocolonigenes TaxID=68170 RepID=A0A0F0GT79_LENAE|nr:hypothetical protein [Lentzea aerocolonigenes]KJK44603.1 hypothetical protein UK23_28895 [Lentzea aerocolonigenes]
MRKTPFVLLVLSLLALLTTPATAAALPGGKTNFVVALGSLKAGSERDNWVRLGDYTFSATGTVTARTYLWWQRHPVARQDTGTTPNGSCSTDAQAVGQTVVRACEVKTAGGFLGDPTEPTKTGDYSVDGSKLHIRWRTAQTWTEQWTITPRADNKLVRLDMTFNSLATTGYAYGSNASLSTGRSMATVRSFPGALRLEQWGWAHDKIAYVQDEPFEVGKYRTCTTTTWCLTYLLTNPKTACQESPSCPGTGGGSAINDRSIQNYVQRISSGDRRDTWWHWCTCLTRKSNGSDIEKCYSGNSHVKPMLQILDDDGDFHGWVAVEGSFYPHNDIPDPRESDMLTVLRISDFR